MNAYLRKSTGIALFLFAATLQARSQTDRGKFEFGLSGGVTIYQGDLTPSRLGSYKTPGINLNLFVNRILNPSFSLRTNLAYGKLKGDDGKYAAPAFRQQRNFNFSSPFLELSELLVWNPIGTSRRLYPYVFGGAGLSLLNVSRDWSRFNAEYFINDNVAARLETDVAHHPPKLIPVVPVGVGVQYSVSKQLSVFAETNYRLTGTDYIDGFSKAANPDLNDHYQTHSVGLKYSFGKRSNLDCPTIIR
jgi:hypothetical protein